jgi:ADP-L-glycero-D-manno-heptose 6-epimerase
MIVVTGAAGFIGSALVAKLGQAGIGDVVAVDWMGRDEKWRNLAKAELVDLIEPPALFPLLERGGEKITAVIHMGAISATTETDIDRLAEWNFRYSRTLAQACALRAVPFIYASSAATYGDGAAGFEDDASPEALAKLRPLNAYGWSKHLFDRWMLRLPKLPYQTPPQWVGLKFFNVYGPNEYHKGEMRSLVVKLAPHLAAGGTADLFKSHRPDFADGGQCRDFIYVEDCVDVILWLLQNRRVSGLFNVGTGRARSFADLAAATFAALGQEPRIRYIEMPDVLRGKYQYFTQAAMDRLRAAGYDRPFTPLEEGVRKTVGRMLSTDPYL